MGTSGPRAFVVAEDLDEQLPAVLGIGEKGVEAARVDAARASLQGHVGSAIASTTAGPWVLLGVRTRGSTAEQLDDTAPTPGQVVARRR